MKHRSRPPTVHNGFGTRISDELTSCKGPCRYRGARLLTSRKEQGDGNEDKRTDPPDEIRICKAERRRFARHELRHRLHGIMRAYERGYSGSAHIDVCSQMVEMKCSPAIDDSHYELHRRSWNGRAMHAVG